MQMSYLYASDFPFKIFCKLTQYAESISKNMFGKRVMTLLVVDKITDHNKPHFDLFFYLNINVKENAFFKVRTEKGIARRIDASSVVWTL